MHCNYSDQSQQEQKKKQPGEQIRIPSYYKAREKLRIQGAISFGLAGDFKPITERSKRNRIITFVRHLKIALNIVL